MMTIINYRYIDSTSKLVLRQSLKRLPVLASANPKLYHVPGRAAIAASSTAPAAMEAARAAGHPATVAGRAAGSPTYTATIAWQEATFARHIATFAMEAGIFEEKAAAPAGQIARCAWQAAGAVERTAASRLPSVSAFFLKHAACFLPV